MRLSALGAAAAWLVLTVAGTAGCAAVSAPAHPSLDSCRSFGVRAIDRHITVRTIPSACAGLTAGQVNQAVQGAIREAVGPLPKATARRRAEADGGYLAPLIHAIRPPAAQIPVAATSQPTSFTAVAVAGLLCWLATAAAGSYLLIRSGMAGRLRRRTGGPASRPPTVVLGHAGLAIGGLAVWIGFAGTGESVLAWLAVGLIMAVAGLGMATLIGGLPEGDSVQRAAVRYARVRAAVPVIAVHGILATVTIVVTILGAIAAR